LGFLEILTGRRKLKGPAPDRLFAISTAYITLQTEHGIEPGGVAAIVFQALSNAEFESLVADMEQVVAATGAESGTKVEREDDEYGYRWMVLRPGSVEDLAVGINAVSGALESGGYGDRLLCAVFAFRDSRHSDRRVYFIYNYKRGFWYPFVPRAGEQNARDVERELQLKAQVSGEMPIEPELERWFPLWGIPL
jgi:hypothetical protein